MRKNTILIIIALILILTFIIVTEFAISRKPTVNISSVAPPENSVTTTLLPQIKAVFIKPVSIDQKDKVKLSTNPEITGSPSWSADNITLSLIPTKSLNVEQRYSLTVRWDSSSYSWNFTTPPIKNLSLEEQMKLQAEADKNYAQAQEKVIQEFPWYNNLPLKTVNYFVYLDVSSKTIKAKLYPQKASPVPINEQVKSLQIEITSKLKKLGIDLSVQKIEWLIIPE